MIERVSPSESTTPKRRSPVSGANLRQSDMATNATHRKSLQLSELVGRPRGAPCASLAAAAGIQIPCARIAWGTLPGALAYLSQVGIQKFSTFSTSDTSMEMERINGGCYLVFQ